MGLDMYLDAEHYVWSHQRDQEIKGHKIKSAKAEAIYWSKANQIHSWFVKNVQDGQDDCGDYYVSREQLAKLRDTCKEVLADHSKAKELLPPQAGFFFGNTEYDEWYFKDLEYTVVEIDRVLEEFDEKDWDFRYSSSW